MRIVSLKKPVTLGNCVFNLLLLLLCQEMWSPFKITFIACGTLKKVSDVLDFLEIVINE